ncbi:ABC transporter ATP-binding protein [Ketogulonicigenium vulgare]|uniref:ABC sugar transporter, fused ATPase subunits n=1 Tax=Ketogulonicigenium vulgare (strain WSH-001) TaxID=759362 RepID=F9Y4W2_KETVW|nr:sn-glycerol-3-phosphate ABC transporter ATP-binding protein UgpC [Ketogulonicigenium vulgare]ADO43570.1 ATP-binding protein of mannitol ABC transporter [Ketogulonicigenium vulgare Y25]AEM41846.1 ABC sugar transporter, fused ATPase subunits [Ketogulonicigenium vulgare WSH-001]ALJ81952.1 ABC transporter ATP-binding protein [Ketogulonicigenium vulgare]ANW34592.1 ABC transporter ATP-binding protein [Ketogulonicigenium vulgare]AOZ55604.1 ATP-binding protein of mannitol ABC transporter [Ketogulon
MAQLSLRDVRKNFKGTEVLRGIDLEIGDRELVVFVGPSGCGKSTLLRMIAGLDDMTSGEFLLNGASMRDVPPSRRGIAMVFQSYALYPHMDVYENMAFGARLQGLDKDEVDRRIQEAARMLRLEPLLKRKPRELSGGQRQRVAIGRALTRKPEVFLLDEPLSNLDAALRSDVRLEIAKLHEDIGGTMIYVTHDQVEAMTLADKIVVMNAGRIEQVGAPRELYERPANTFVATFIGSPRMTLIRATRKGDAFAVAGSGAVELPGAPASGTEVTLGVRPDAFEIAQGGQGFGAEFVYSEYLGNDAYVYARLGDGTLVSARTDPAPRPERPGERITLRPIAAAVHFFDGESGQRL